MSEPPTAADTPAPTGRVIDLSVEVPGSPEEVWAAVATGPGISAWFVPHEVEERSGGTATVDFGAFGAVQAEVQTWEPPHRVVFTGGPPGRTIAYQWTVQARSGDRCEVRLVASGFGDGEDWDAEYDGTSLGWLLFLGNLRLHRTHFAGRRARTVLPLGMAPGPNETAWARLCGDLGIDPAAPVGTAVATAGADVPALSGRVEQVFAVPDRLTAYLLVIDTPAPGTAILAAEGGPGQVMLSFHQYRYDPDGGEPADPVDDWTPWFAARYPLAAEVPAG